jgi:Phosphoenolpyruvate phosphomutase
VQEAGFPNIFISGFNVASAHGLPDTGYIAMQEMCDKFQEIARQVTIPIMADGDTGCGGPMNVRRTVEAFAKAGAAGVMIEDQTWPKRKKAQLMKSKQINVRIHLLSSLVKAAVIPKVNQSSLVKKLMREFEPLVMLVTRARTFSFWQERMHWLLAGRKPLLVPRSSNAQEVYRKWNRSTNTRNAESSILSYDHTQTMYSSLGVLKLGKHKRAHYFPAVQGKFDNYCDIYYIMIVLHNICMYIKLVIVFKHFHPIRPSYSNFA